MDRYPRVTPTVWGPRYQYGTREQGYVRPDTPAYSMESRNVYASPSVMRAAQNAIYPQEGMGRRDILDFVQSDRRRQSLLDMLLMQSGTDPTPQYYTNQDALYTRNALRRNAVDRIINAMYSEPSLMRSDGNDY